MAEDSDILMEDLSRPRPGDDLSTAPIKNLSTPILHSSHLIVLFPFLILCAQLVSQAGIGVGLAPLHIIGDHYGITNPGERSWYVAAFSLTAGTFILPAGRLGDMYGHKKLFVGGFAWYELWSVLCGASYYSNDIFFIVARAFQGLAPALLAPNALAHVGRTYPEGMKRNLIFSLYGACAPGGYVLGAAFSSLLAQRVTWAWSYWIMGFVCFMLSALAVIAIPTPDRGPPGDETREKEKQKSITWVH
ncbi:Low affinity NH4+ transporter [Lambiella insularis]|nr:Low affinity NH4+ transporter [Lambiella insularis]